MYAPYIFPNEAHEPVLWGLMIVLYPFMTCTIFGGLMVSCLPTLCGRKSLVRSTRLALAVALSGIPFAFLPILLHLGQPVRALNIMRTPRFSSPMAVFGFVFSLVAGIVIFKTWLMFRQDLLARAQKHTGILRLFYAVLSLGITEITPEADRIDRTLVKILRVIAIPAAAILPGYVAFDFATCPGNPWWNSTLRPVVFLLLGVVNGCSLTMIVGSVLRPSLLSDAGTRTLGRILMGTLAVVAVFSVLEIAEIHFVEGYPKIVVEKLFSGEGPLWMCLFPMQLGVGTALPIVLFGLALLLKLRGPLLKLVALIVGSLGLCNTLVVLWSVIVGGQLVSKSFRSVGEYTVPMGGQEGLIAALIIVTLPLFAFVVIGCIVPRVPEKELDHAGDGPTP